MAEVEVDGKTYRWNDDEYNKAYRDPELLYELYHIEEYSSLHTIGDFFGVDGKTIQRWLEKGGYETRSQSESMQMNAPEELTDADYLRELYHSQKMSLRDIAEEIGVHHEHVRYYFNKHGIERRERLEAKKHYNSPYFYTSDSGHEKIVHEYDGERCNVEVHRLLCLVKYEIDELKGMDVHHTNSIPWDNRLENLNLMKPSDHYSLHNNPEKVVF